MLSELKDLTVTYAKQETVDPLKHIGRFLGYGVPGTVLLGIGLSLIGLAGLRALQTETGTRFTGNWSWAPYVIVLGALGFFALLAIWAIFKESRRAKKRKKETAS
ncbi:MAG: hypothetical protein ACRD0G_08480 [Acidimicrobiales bacterium]